MARMSDEGSLTHESLLSSFVESKRRGEQSAPECWTSLNWSLLTFSTAGERGWPILTFEEFQRKHGVTEKDGKLELKIDFWDEDFEHTYVYSNDGLRRD